MDIFVVGATGYIGGTVAERLRQAGHRVRGLARTEARASALRQKGIEPIVGSLDDTSILEVAARAADVVISAADADHRPSVEALLRALSGSGKKLIHTSGSSIVSTDAKGEPTTSVYDEDTLPEPIADKGGRVSLDRDVLSAARGGVRSVVICPTMIYGEGSGVNPQSIQVPSIVADAKSTGTAHWIGRGENVWSNVHIDDLADLYLLALEKSPAGTFYFAENGEQDLKSIAEAVALRLALPAGSYSADEALQTWGMGPGRIGLGSNSRVRAKRARTLLGWRPHRPSILEWLSAAAL